METIGLAFSQEEVVFLLALLRSEFIPGLGKPPLGDMNEDEIKVAIAGAERGLVARGLLAILPETTVQIEELTLVLVGTSAYPKYSLLVSLERDSAKEWHYFHIGEKHISVEHTVPQNGVHLFTAYKNEDECLTRIVELLNLSGQSTPSDAPATVSQNTLRIVADLATIGKTEQAQRLLIKEGLEPSAASLLVANLGSSTNRVNIVAIRHGNVEQVRLINDTLLLGDDGCWMLEQFSEAQNDNLTIYPVTASALRGLLREQLTIAA